MSRDEEGTPISLNNNRDDTHFMRFSRPEIPAHNSKDEEVETYILPIEDINELDSASFQPDSTVGPAPIQSNLEPNTLPTSREEDSSQRKLGMDLMSGHQPRMLIVDPAPVHQPKALSPALHYYRTARPASWSYPSQSDTPTGLYPDDPALFDSTTDTYPNDPAFLNETPIHFHPDDPAYFEDPPTLSYQYEEDTPTQMKEASQALATKIAITALNKYLKQLTMDSGLSSMSTGDPTQKERQKKSGKPISTENSFIWK